MTDDEIVRDAWEIAWNVLDRSGELTGGDQAARMLFCFIMEMVTGGERRRLMLVNRAIDKFRESRSPLKLAG